MGQLLTRDLLGKRVTEAAYADRWDTLDDLQPDSVWAYWAEEGQQTFLQEFASPQNLMEYEYADGEEDVELDLGDWEAGDDVEAALASEPCLSSLTGRQACLSGRAGSRPPEVCQLMAPAEVAIANSVEDVELNLGDWEAGDNVEAALGFVLLCMPRRVSQS